MNKFNHYIKLRHDLREPTQIHYQAGASFAIPGPTPISMLSGNLPLLTARVHLIAGNCASVLEGSSCGSTDSVRIIRN